MINLNNPGAQEYFNLACWLKDKVEYNYKSKLKSYRSLQINRGEIWYCDFGYNIGTEKNKCRPAIVMSNNRINKSGKVVVLCITDADGKVNSRNLPAQDSWMLLYSDTTEDDKKFKPGRCVPSGATVYSFLIKDSIVQCEEIRSVSKARLDKRRGCIGRLSSGDMAILEAKFARTFR